MIPYGPLTLDGTGRDTFAGETWLKQAHPQAYAITEAQVGSTLYQRFECREGDFATSPPDGTVKNRAEFQAATRYRVGEHLWLSDQIRIGAGDAFTAAFNLIGQCHDTADEGESGVTPPFAMNLLPTGKLRFIRRYSSAATTSSSTITTSVMYETAVLSRDRWYRRVVHIVPGFNNNGTVEVWFDGVKVVSLTNTNVGYNSLLGMYYKFGIYRTASPETCVVEFANLEIGSTSLLSRVANPLVLDDATNDLTASGGGFLFSGKAAGLKRSLKLPAASRAFTLTGQSATLSKSGLQTLLTASNGAFSLSGSAGLKLSRKLSASPGSAAVTGRSAGLFRELVVTADPGAFELTTPDAGLRHDVNYNMTASVGSYASDGSATLTKTGALKVLVADPATFSVDASVTLAKATTFQVSQGTFALTGQSATLTKRASGLLGAQAGLVRLTGQDAALRFDRVIPASQGAFTLAGQEATLSADYRLSADPGAATVAGNADLTILRFLTYDAGVFTISGEAGLSVSAPVSAKPLRGKSASSAGRGPKTATARPISSTTTTGGI